jgi:ribosomal protein S21
MAKILKAIIAKVGNLRSRKCNRIFEYISKGLYRKKGVKKRVLF